ncbi:hypothetical protein G7046_g3132 [Stylonectria norvegica]|nr:hypothetical protein G7046_g3132 [Stylonectria norvegica]
MFTTRRPTGCVSFLNGALLGEKGKLLDGVCLLCMNMKSRASVGIMEGSDPDLMTAAATSVAATVPDYCLDETFGLPEQSLLEDRRLRALDHGSEWKPEYLEPEALEEELDAASTHPCLAYSRVARRLRIAEEGGDIYEVELSRWKDEESLGLCLCFPAYGFIIGGLQQKIRSHYGIKGSTCNDFGDGCMSPSYTLVRGDHEIMMRDELREVKSVRTASTGQSIREPDNPEPYISPPPMATHRQPRYRTPIGEHGLGRDPKYLDHGPPARTHELRSDQTFRGGTPVVDHRLSKDAIYPVPEDDSIPPHELRKDQLVPLPRAGLPPHDLHVDEVVPNPTAGLPPHNLHADALVRNFDAEPPPPHRLSADQAVQNPTTGPAPHDLVADEAVRKPSVHFPHGLDADTAVPAHHTPPPHRLEDE